MTKRQNEKEIKAVRGRDQTRDRILSSALKLLDAGGRDAVTTRAVAEAAGVQPPVLYRLFEDKDGLLNALAEHGFTLYLAQKQASDAEQDPVEALSSGWDRHVQFGLSHPALYLLMYVQPGAGTSPAAELSFAMLRRHMGRVAQAGRLQIAEDRAVAVFHAAAMGTVVTLLRWEETARDNTISAMARDNTLSLIAVTARGRSKTSPASAAARTLDAAVKLEDGFSPGELTLFKEWLSRLKNR